MVDLHAPLGEQALEYADQYGYEVFPLVPKGEYAKSPYAGTNGVLEATTDLNRIRAWWEEHPDALIGHRIPPEELILDVDPRHGGMDVFLALKAEYAIVPSRVHISGRGDGGGHLHFQRPVGRLSVKKLSQWAKDRDLGEDLGNGRWSSGIDLLHRDHRYTILPASPHPATGAPYYWRGRGPEDPPGTLPEGLVELLTPDPAEDRPPPGPYDPNSIADWFSATMGFGWLTDHGWELVRGNGTSDGSAWRHPRATNAISATIRYRCLFVYSENTPFEVTMPDDPAGYTAFRAWAILCHGNDLRAAARAARDLKQQVETAEILNSTGAVPLARVKPQHIKWLWHPYLPLGKMVIHAGEPGMMKSSFDIAVAAQITTGTGFAERFGPQRVVFLNFEDDDEDGLVPRLLAAGADLENCYSVPEEIANPAGLKKVVDEVRPLAFFVDPFGSWAEAVENTGMETQIRRALKPLRQLARATGAMAKVNCHPNKQNTLSDALYRIAGSLGGMVGYGRVVLASRQGDDGYLAGIVKSNVGPGEIGIEYFAQFIPVDLEEGVSLYPRVMFGNEVPIERATFFSSEDKGQSQVEGCAERIKQLLAEGVNGERFAGDIKDILVREGFSEYAINKGRRVAGAAVSGTGRSTKWILAGGTFVAQSGEHSAIDLTADSALRSARDDSAKDEPVGGTFVAQSGEHSECLDLTAESGLRTRDESANAEFAEEEGVV